MQQSHRAAPVAFLAAPPSPSSASEAAPRPSPARRVPSPSSRRMPSYTGMLALLLAVLPCVSSQNGKSALVWDLCVICFRGRCHLYDDRHPAALQSGWFVEARDEIRARHKWERLHKIRAYFNSICLHEECFPSAHHILQSRSSCCLRSPFWHSHLRTCDERSRDWGEAQALCNILMLKVTNTTKTVIRVNFETEIYTSKHWINTLSIDVWFVRMEQYFDEIQLFENLESECANKKT